MNKSINNAKHIIYIIPNLISFFKQIYFIPVKRGKHYIYYLISFHAIFLVVLSLFIIIILSGYLIYHNTEVNKTKALIISKKQRIEDLNSEIIKKQSILYSSSSSLVDIDNLAKKMLTIENEERNNNKWATRLENIYLNIIAALILFIISLIIKIIVFNKIKDRKIIKKLSKILNIKQ